MITLYQLEMIKRVIVYSLVIVRTKTMLYSNVKLTKFPSIIRKMIMSFVKSVNADRSSDNFEQAIENFYKTLEENGVKSEIIHQIEQELGF
jgi:predicted Zn-dependent peptidase